MKYTKTILPNGVRVITVPMESNPTVTVMVHVATGSFHETKEQSGISHFLEHMCFKGTEKRPSSRIISTELDSIGAAYNAFTDRDMTGYYAKADVKHFAKIADIVSDIFKHSILPEVEIEKEKGVVIGEIDMYADDPQEKIYDALMEHMFSGEPASRHVLGTKETVTNITRDALVSYRKSQYVASNIVVTIAGGVKEGDMVSWAKETFSDVSNGQPALELPTRSRAQKGPETVFVEKDTDQAHIIVAWRIFDTAHPDKYVGKIIRNLLRGGMSSRLFIKLRDELGSGYYVGAGQSTHKTFGYFSISTGTRHDRVSEIVGAILNEVDKLKKDLVPENELSKIKEFMRAHLRMGLETSDDVADFCAHQEVVDHKIKTPEDFDAIYSKITREDVQRVAQTMFDANKLTVAVIGKKIDTDSVRKILSI